MLNQNIIEKEAVLDSSGIYLYKYYKLTNNNPFEKDVFVIPTATKNGYVKYSFNEATEKEGFFSSMNIRSFLKLYTEVADGRL